MRPGLFSNAFMKSTLEPPQQMIVTALPIALNIYDVSDTLLDNGTSLPQKAMGKQTSCFSSQKLTVNNRRRESTVNSNEYPPSRAITHMTILINSTKRWCNTPCNTKQQLPRHNKNVQLKTK